MLFCDSFKGSKVYIIKTTLSNSHSKDSSTDTDYCWAWQPAYNPNNHKVVTGISAACWLSRTVKQVLSRSSERLCSLTYALLYMWWTAVKKNQHQPLTVVENPFSVNKNMRSWCLQWIALLLSMHTHLIQV